LRQRLGQCRGDQPGIGLAPFEPLKLTSVVDPLPLTGAVTVPVFLISNTVP
jgi:hypothetical protein